MPETELHESLLPDETDGTGEYQSADNVLGHQAPAWYHVSHWSTLTKCIVIGVFVLLCVGALVLGLVFGLSNSSGNDSSNTKYVSTSAPSVAPSTHGPTNAPSVAPSVAPTTTPGFNSARVINSADFIADRKADLSGSPQDGIDTICGGNVIAMSGGGTRAASCTVGGYRALQSLMPKFQGASSVSGGTWASSIFMFAPSSVSDTTLLGETTSPAELTLEYLNTSLPAQAILTPVSGHSIELVEKVVLLTKQGKLSPEDMWIVGVGELFLSPFDLSTTEFSDLILRPGRPAYYKMEATIEAPFGHAATAESVQPFDMGPFLTGSPLYTTASKTVTYASVVDVCKEVNKYWKIWEDFGRVKKTAFKKAAKKIIAARNMQYAAAVLRVPIEGVVKTCQSLPPHFSAEQLTVPGVGGEVQSFAANGEAPTTFPRMGTMLLPKPDVPFTLSRAVACSSAAFAGAFSHTNMTSKINPVQTIWPVGPTQFGDVGTNSPALNHSIGDGGNLDNSGLLTMIRRGATKAIAFDSGDTEFVNSTVADFCDQNLNMTDVNYWASDTTNALFGYGEDNLGAWYSNNQIFEKALLRPLLCDLQEIVATGKPAVIHKQLNVLENSFWGTLASEKPIDVIFVFNYRCTDFIEALPDDTQAEISKGETGMFANFPYYSTTFQNPPEPLTLTLPQAQLLAAHSEYAIKENLVMIKAVFPN